MARSNAVQVNCERCGKLEIRPVTDDIKSFKAALTGKDGSIAVEFTDLCKKCAQTLENYMGVIEREKRGAPEKEEYEEPPSPEAKKSGGFGSILRK